MNKNAISKMLTNDWNIRCELYVPYESDKRYQDYLLKLELWFEWYQLMIAFHFPDEQILKMYESLKKNQNPYPQYAKTLQIVKNLIGEDLERVKIGVDKNRFQVGNSFPNDVEILDKIYNFSINNSLITPDYWLVNTIPTNYYKWYIPFYFPPKKVCYYESNREKNIKDKKRRDALRPKPTKMPDVKIPEYGESITGPNGLGIGSYNPKTKVFTPYINPGILNYKDNERISKDMKWLRKISLQNLNKYLDKKIPDLRSNKMDEIPQIYKDMIYKFFTKTPEYF